MVHSLINRPAQTILIAANDTKEARTAIQELPTIGKVATCCLHCKQDDDTEDSMMLCDKCDRVIS